MNWIVLAELDAAAQYYLDDGLARHTQCWYRLTAQGEAGSGTPATLATATGYAAVAAPVAGWAEGELATTEIAYQYDELSRLTEANYSDGTYFHYEYDANGNRLSETTAAGAVESVYDVSNRLTSVGGVAYTWDVNGNLTGDGARTYAYDSANRLVSVSADGAEVASYAYNGFGDRLVENETQFVMDLNSGLTQALQEGENTYLYGNGRIGQFAGEASASFLGDALGSVRQLVDGEGEVTLVQSYAPYGEVVESTGDGETNYTYTGEWNDASTNLLYLRARYYSGNMGRFLTKDTWQGDFNLPMSYNAWLYVFSNPVNRIDPTGHFPCGDGFDNPGCEQLGSLNNALSNDEKLVLLALIIGESTSGGQPLKVAEMNMWMLLNKHSHDINQKNREHESFYKSWRGEESGFIDDECGGLAALAERYAVNALSGCNKLGCWKPLAPEQEMQALAQVSHLYETGKIKNNSGNGVNLQNYYRELVVLANKVIPLWYTYGPNSAFDPINGGTGRWDASPDNKADPNDHPTLRSYDGTNENGYLEEEDMRDIFVMQKTRDYHAKATWRNSYVTTVYHLNNGDPNYLMFTVYTR